MLEPGFLAFSLKGWSVSGIGDHFLKFAAGGFFVAFFDEQLGVLDSGLGIGVVFQNFAPAGESSFLIAESGQCFGVHHHALAVFVLWIFLNDLLQNWQGFFGTIQPEEALAVVGARIQIFAIAFESRKVFFFCFLQFALRKINVRKLGVMVSFIQVVDLVLKLLDAPASGGAWEFEGGGV